MTAFRDLPENSGLEEFLMAQGIDPGDFYRFQELMAQSGGILPASRPRVLLTEAVRMFEAEYLPSLSSLSAEDYRRIIREFLDFMLRTWRLIHVPDRDMSADRVTPGNVEDFLVQHGGTGRTINKRLAVIRSFFGRFLIRRKLLLERNPSDGLKWRDQDDLPPVFLSKSEQEALLALARATRNGNRDEAILFTALNSGLRVSELAELKFTDLDFERGFINVRKGKGDKFRAVPMVWGVREVLLGYVDFRRLERVSPARNHGQYLFIVTSGSRRGRGMKADTIEKMAKPLFNAIGRPDANMHALRHTFAVALLDAGVHIEVTRAVLGHVSIETTRRYLRLGDAKVKEAMQEHFPFAVCMPPFLERLYGRPTESAR